MFSARQDFSICFKDSPKKSVFQQSRREAKNAKNKSCTVIGRSQHSLPVITLCFPVCLCYFHTVCCAELQRSWLWQLLSLQCWWRAQGPDIQLIPGSSVWVQGLEEQLPHIIIFYLASASAGMYYPAKLFVILALLPHLLLYSHWIYLLCLGVTAGIFVFLKLKNTT